MHIAGRLRAHTTAVIITARVLTIASADVSDTNYPCEKQNIASCANLLLNSAFDRLAVAINLLP
jgi:hypothetical protein